MAFDFDIPVDLVIPESGQLVRAAKPQLPRHRLRGDPVVPEVWTNCPDCYSSKREEASSHAVLTPEASSRIPGRKAAASAPPSGGLLRSSRSEARRVARIERPVAHRLSRS